MKTITIRGMSCRHCVMAVTRALNSIEGIRDVTVNLEQGTATFEEDCPVDMSKVKEAIERAGYEAG